MLVVLKAGVDEARVRRALIERGLWLERLDATRYLVGAHSATVDRAALLAVDGVAEVAMPESPHPRVDAQPSVLRLGRRPIELGVGAAPVLIAGPCSVESEAHVRQAAERVAASGATFLRGGAFKPRTSPYAFQGHGREALVWLRRAADAAGLNVVTEALAPEDAPLVAEYADLIQVGSRNMHSAPLLRAAGRTHRPVLVKRGFAATVEEWLLAGETCLLHGAAAVVFCERGIRGFDPQTRNVLDLGAVALLAHAKRLPVIVDPSHAAGRRDLVVPLARAALAAGAAGVMIEVHDDPGRALSDGPQALRSEELAQIFAEVAHV